MVDSGEASDDAHVPTIRGQYLYLKSRTRAVRLTRGALTKGSPQYVHQQIWGLSTLMKIFGCPNGPPPPSQDTVLVFVHLTGCLWMRLMAASGCGYATPIRVSHFHRTTMLDGKEVSSTDRMHLILHNGLFKSRTTHRPLPWLLTSTPRPLPVRRLHYPLPFAVLGQLLQRAVGVT